MILPYLLTVDVAVIFVFLFSAAEWKLDEPDWTGRLKVSAKGHNLHIRLEDKNTGKLIIIVYCVHFYGAK